MEQAPAPQKEKRRISLRWSLAAIILAFWVVPVVLTVVVSGFLSVRGTRSRVSDIVSISIQSVMDNVQRDLDTAVNTAVSLSYVPIVRDAYNQYLQDGNLVDLYNTPREFLSQQYSRSQVVFAAHLLFPDVPEARDRRCYAFNPTNARPDQVLAFYSSTAHETALAMMKDLDTNIGFFEDGGNLYLARNLSLRNNRYVPYAMLVTQINLPYLYAGLETLPWLTDVTLEVAGIPLVVDGERADPTAYDGVEPLGQGGAPTALEGNHLLVSDRIKGERYVLNYYVRADLQPLMAELGTQGLTLLWLVLLATVLMAFVMVFFMRKINTPITRLSTLAGRIEQGELGAQADAEKLGSAEFYYLGTQMNAMSERLREQFERLYREELALRDARIKALQSQINPHFLGNTLEAINWEARLAGNVKASQMLEALSTILRATQDRGQKPLVHLSEEMMYVNAYLYIEKERLGKRLVVTQEIDEDLLDWYVPRLILQPIVENAIDHGVTKRQRGAIVIRAFRLNENWMQLEVDNDSPMSPQDEANVACLLGEEERRLNLSGNIGIKNVHQRLRLLYGGQGGLTIQTDEKEHTISSMCIRKHQEPQESTI